MDHLHLSQFNLWAVLVCAVIQWVLGALWYSLLFAKPWMAMTGHTKGERPKGAVVAMSLSFFGGLVLAFVLAHMILWAHVMTAHRGGFVGAICWLGFIAVPLCSQHLFEKRPYKLYAINAGYWLASLVISGAVLGYWH
jgi:hypothetical protein